jgi:hypothetical protein
MKTTSLASTVSRIRFAIVVLPEPVPPEMPIIKLIPLFIAYFIQSSPINARRVLMQFRAKLQNPAR